MCDAVDQREQFHVAAVGLHIRAHAVERLRHAFLEADRIEVVDQQQAAHGPILGQVLGTFRCNVDQRVAFLHDSDGVSERLKIERERQAVGATPYPSPQFRDIGRR